MKKILDFKIISRKKIKKYINSKYTREEDINKEEHIGSIFNEDTSYNELFSEDQIKSIKFDFQKNHGKDDKFNFLSEEHGIKTEVNGYRGIIKVTVGKNEEIILNYFETLDYLYEKSQKDILYG